jgi:RNA polymerase sigma factor (sigma-70 family)
VTTTAFDPHIAHLLRDLAPRVLAVVARRHDDFAAAEDAVQDALIAAASQWPDAGIPDNPKGWLYHVARRRLTDQMRSESARRRREEAVAAELIDEPSTVAPADAEMVSGEDDALVLLYMCCHPALTGPSSIALTLRAVGGLTTTEIASAFLVPEATMAQRISRAKQSIKTSRIPFSMPGESDRAARLHAVLHVLYLIFSEGYTASNGASLHRADLSNEAIRLTRVVRQALPRNSEVAGLLALMLLTDARRAARATADGELIPLDEQDRSRWDRASIEEGRALVAEALTTGGAGLYAIQAAIAALHDEAPRAADTDWPQILALYEVLKRLSDNPMIALNHAIAYAMVRGPAAGLALLDALDDDSRIRGHYRLDAVRAHLLERMGDAGGAIARYRAAARRTASTPERNYLLMKAARLAQPPSNAT